MQHGGPEHGGPEHRRAHSCADVDVRACLHAPYHARCGLTGTRAQACTMMHTHHGTCARARTGTQSWALTHKSDRAVHICAGDRAGAALVLVHIDGGTEADLRYDSGMVGRTWSGNIEQGVCAHAGRRPRRPTRRLLRRRRRTRVSACAISCTLWAHGHACTGMHDDAHTTAHAHMRTRTHRHPIMGAHA